MIPYLITLLLGAVLGRASRRSTVQYAVVPVISALPIAVASPTAFRRGNWTNRHGHKRYGTEGNN